MRKWLLLGLFPIISGCLSLDRDVGCKTTYKQGPKWSVGGIDIPINLGYSIEKVKIGPIEYTGAQAQELADYVQVLDQRRLSNCGIMYSPGFSTMAESFRQDVYSKILAANEALDKLALGLKQAKSPADGVKAAAEAVKEPAKPAAALEIREEQVRFSLATAIQRINTLESSLRNLDAEVKRIGALPPATHIQVLGFARTGASLVPERKLELTQRFQQALDTIPLERTPSVLVVGYADSSGTSAKNVELGLRRASEVAEYLRRQQFKRDYKSKITSGGIGGSDMNGRRVEIFISSARHFTMPSTTAV